MIEIQKEIKSKFKKALSSVVLAVSLIAANISPVQIADNTLAFADEKPKEMQNINNTIAQQGNCGEKVVWKLDTEGQLTISGTGDMSEWSNSDNSKDNQDPPWNNLKENITAVIIENGVTSVSAEAFFGCSKVKKIVLGNDVTRIGNKAFADCESLENINVNNNENPYFYSYDGCLYQKNTYTLYVCPAGKRQVLISPSINAIQSGAFWGCNKLKEIKLPGNFLKEIGSYAFYQCDALTKIVIPKKVTDIKEYTFAGCSTLTEFEVSETMKSIDSTAFSGCEKLNICGLKDSYAQQYAQQTNLPFKEIPYWNGGVIAVNPWDGRIDTSWYTEEKTELFISTPQQLAGLAELVNKGNTFEGKILRLTNDIFLNDRMKSTEYEWVPIAYSADKEDTGLVFQGTFDGGGYHIYNLYTSNKGQGGGLFGRIGEKGVVKAVTISQGYLNYGGSIAYNNDGWILFCNNDSMTEVYGKESSYTGDCGAICNFNSNLVYGCRNYGCVYSSDSLSDAAGIVGRNTVSIATVSECSNIGIVQGYVASGIVSYNEGWIQNCYNIGKIIGRRYAAGITYYNYVGIGNCYFAGGLEISGEYGNRGAIYEEDMTPAKKPKNCYAIFNNYYVDSPTMLTYEEMTSAELVNKLNRQAYTACFGWYLDEYGINDGFPINSADYSAYQKKYKMAPEIWVEGREPKAEGKVGTTITIGYPYSYAEKIPSITVDNPEIAEVANQSTTESIKAVLELKKAGTTQITIAFSETENNRAAEYKIDLTVEGRKIIYGDTNGDGDVNSKDAVLLKKHLAGYTGLDIDMEAADVNADGNIDSKDAVRLLRHLAGYEVN